MANIGSWLGGRRTAKDGLPPPDGSAMRPASAMPSLSRNDAALLLRTYEETGQGWFWSTDREGRLTYISSELLPVLDGGRGTPIGAAIVELFVQADEEAKAGRTLHFIFAKHTRFEKLTLRAVHRTQERWWSVSGAPCFDASGAFAGYRGSGVDVTEQRRSTERAAKLAMYDSLTGLPNRLHMAETLEAKLLALEVQKRPCAIMLIDLDRFKQVNDTLGHPAGDQLLKQVAVRLRKTVGDDGLVFRLGGDEFQVIVPDCKGRDALGHIAGNIINTLSQPYTIDGSRCVIGASVGMAVSPADGRTSEDLTRNADLALYAAKAAGRGRFNFFSTELLDAAEDRRRLEEDLRDALAKGEFRLHYQPVVDTRNDCMVAVEALLRWHHPERGPISPALFIPIAEEADLIRPLGEWTLRKACEDAAQWPGKLRVAVNVSPIQFASETLPQIVLSALAASGLPPERLELEITEGVFLAESAQTDGMFVSLKDIGVRLALDDFGTGYSSLGYLKSAPFDKIKIDQSFVREATLPGSRNRAIIAAIVALAEAMGMETTAEGIETLDQLELVRELRVGTVQGYIYSKAIPNDELQGRLGTGNLSVPPTGPARQRSTRQTMYRKAGAIAGHHYHAVLVRNLSDSGALIEGLPDMALDSQILLDLSEGQLVFGRVRRVHKRQSGIEFEQPLIDDGQGGLGTGRRVSAYQLRMAGLPTSPPPGGDAGGLVGITASLDGLRSQLGLDVPPPASAKSGNGARGGPIGTLADLAESYLAHIQGNRQRHATESVFLRDKLLPRFGKMRPDELSSATIGGWLAGEVDDAGLAPFAANRLRVVIRRLQDHAMQWGGPGVTGAMVVGERGLTAVEIARLEKAARASANPHLKFIVPLLLMTGVRQRDLLKARWEHLDLSQRIWRIPAQARRTEQKLTLSADAVALIDRLPRWDGCPWLVANPRTQQPYRSFTESWNSVRVKAGLPDVELDDLRFSTANRAAGGERAGPVAGTMQAAA